jgi:hypothetical protein
MRGAGALTAVVFAMSTAFATAAFGAGSDDATAKKLVITKADAGTGFAVTPSTPGPDDFAQIAECVGKPIRGRTVVAHVDGPELQGNGTHETIASNVDIVKTKKMVAADRAVVQDPGFPDCFAKVAGRQAGAGTQVNTQRARVKRYGDYSTALFTRAQGTANGKPVTESIVSVGIMKGRAELLAQFVTDSSVPFDRTQAQKILDKVAKRLDAANV